MTGETAVQGQAIAEEGEVEYIFFCQHLSSDDEIDDTFSFTNIYQSIIKLTKYLGGVYQRR